MGALSAALIAQSSGLRVICLGPQLPGEQVVLACKTTGAKLVCVSFTQNPAKRVKDEVFEIAVGIPEDVEIWIGGQSSDALRVTQPGNSLIIDNLQDYKNTLRRFRVRHVRLRR